MIVHHFGAVFDLVVLSVDFFEREKERDSMIINGAIIKPSPKKLSLTYVIMHFDAY